MPRFSENDRQAKSSTRCTLSAAELAALEQGGGAKNRAVIAVLAVLVVVCSLLSLGVGRYGIAPADVLGALAQIPGLLFGDGSLRVDDAVGAVVLNIRLPRILAALLIGAALAVAGASYQGVFCNPMVSSDILGASAGAGFGASLAILLGAPGVVVQVAAFVCGMAAVGITYLIANAVGRGTQAVLALVLAGIVIQALFQAFISCAKYLADPYSQLPEITYWLMGSLSTVNFDDILLTLAPLAVGLVTLYVLRWRINLLSMGDEEAATMGVNTRRLRLVIIACATLVTGAAVSVAGQVGWIGLVVPHLARMLVGPDYRYLMPASLLLGGVFLLVVDMVARTVMQAEIPLGILTAIIGAPLFVALLLKGRKGWA